MKKVFRVFLSIFIFWGIKFLFCLIRIFPIKFVYWFAENLSGLYYIVSKRNRNLALRNLQIVLGNQSNLHILKKIIRQSCSTMGIAVIDTIRYHNLPAKKVKTLIKIQGLENLEQAFKNGKGVIIVSAHLGSFTILGCRLIVEGYPVNFVMRPMRYKRMEKIAISLSSKIGQNIIFTRPSHSFIRGCLDALAKNELLFLAIDQNFGKLGVPVKFFSSQAKCPAGPFTLSKHSGASVVPMFMINKPNHAHLLCIEPALELDFNARHRGRNLQPIADVLEKYVRKYPGQWESWTHKPWQTGTK
ncbi:MAG: hypothetical protein DRP78_00725 [Candidatus Omnitrophota bacterium]|nr:MAG: hypothetical protein DRP78_00725 [Candidatus Omnitrophota bacterium]